MRRIGADTMGPDMRRKHLSSGYHPSGCAADLGDLHEAAFDAPRRRPGEAGCLPDDAAHTVQRPSEPLADPDRTDPAGEEGVKGDCASCRCVSRFGNCGDPVAAGLGRTFVLVAHPQGGRGCPAYAPVNVEAGVSYWRLHGPDGPLDLAVCPARAAGAVRHFEPAAEQVEPVAYADAWPGRS